MLRVAAAIAACLVFSIPGPTQRNVPRGNEVTIEGSMVCNGACIPDPKDDDHVMVLYAVDGAPAISAEVDRLMADLHADEGLDGDAAEALLND